MQTKQNASLVEVFTRDAKIKLLLALLILRSMSMSQSSQSPPERPSDGTTKLLAILK
jgi:hypothetical protein